MHGWFVCPTVSMVTTSHATGLGKILLLCRQLALLSGPWVDYVVQLRRYFISIQTAIRTTLKTSVFFSPAFMSFHVVAKVRALEFTRAKNYFFFILLTYKSSSALTTLVFHCDPVRPQGRLLCSWGGGVGWGVLPMTNFRFSDSGGIRAHVLLVVWRTLYHCII